MTQTAPPPEDPALPAVGTRPDLVSAARAPLFVGHRGASLLYPEHSMEGYRAVAQDGFPPEPDVHALADGTLVCIHDFSADRTMTGVTGEVSALTREEWLAARITPAPAGGADAQPVLFEQVLDEFGGRTLLVPEIKDHRPASVTAFIRAITDRGLERAVIAQSFDYGTALRLADDGLATLLLIGDGRSLPDTFTNIRRAGIEYVGPGMDAQTFVIAEAARAGLRSIVYTVNSREDARKQLERGAFGVFSDDVWTASGRTAHR